MKPKIDQLVKFEIFAQFEPGELAAVANALKVHTAPRESAIFEEGAAGQAMFFVVSGLVRIERGNGEELASLRAPTILGEMAILENKPRSARAVAADECLLWEMDVAALNRLAQQGSPAAYKIMRWIALGLSERLRKMNEVVHQLNERVLSMSETQEW